MPSGEPGGRPRASPRGVRDGGTTHEHVSEGPPITSISTTALGERETTLRAAPLVGAGLLLAVGVVGLAAGSATPPAWATFLGSAGGAALLAIAAQIEWARPRARAGTFFVATLALAFPTWLFSLQSPFAGFLTLVVMLATFYLERPEGTAVLGGLVVATAAPNVLVAAGVLPDASLNGFFARGLGAVGPTLYGLVWTEVLLVISFVAARETKTRYERLGEQVSEGRRAARLQEALLDEARNEYRRALAAAQRPGRGSTVTRVHDEHTAPLASPVDHQWAPRDPAAEPARTATAGGAERIDGDVAPRGRSGVPSVAATSTPSPIGDRTAGRWVEAHDRMLALHHAALPVLCVVGSVALLGFPLHPLARILGWAGMATVAALVLRHRAAYADDPSLDLPWTRIAAAAIGPCYAFGLHTAFCIVPVMHLLLAGLFRVRHRPWERSRLIRIVAALSGTHAVTFGLVVLGVLPDGGSLPILGPSLAAAFGEHLVLQAIFVGTAVIARRIDHAYDALVRRAADDAAEEARLEGTRRATNAALEALLAEPGQALFAGRTFGRFRLDRLLAHGGMGEVYEGVDLRTGEAAAIKILRFEALESRPIVALFEREGRHLARVESPHVVRCLGLEAEGGLPLIAMELIHGPTLGAVLRERQRLTPVEVVELLAQMGRALDAVHGAKLVHRDVTPNNIMRASRTPDVWKLVDLGVAELAAELRDPQERLVGTPSYASPEQARGEGVDARSDIFSLGLVAFRALTGHRAHVADTFDEAAVEREPDPRALAAIPDACADVLRIALAPSKEERFASASAFAQAFEQAVRGRVDPELRLRADAISARTPWRTRRVRERPEVDLSNAATIPRDLPRASPG